MKASSPGPKATPGSTSGSRRRSARRLHGGRVALGTRAGDTVRGRSLRTRERQRERWIAAAVVIDDAALRLTRIIESPRQQWRRRRSSAHCAVGRTPTELDSALDDRPGAPRRADNVPYTAEPPRILGYVDAMHQSTRPFPGPGPCSPPTQRRRQQPGRARREPTALLAKNGGRGRAFRCRAGARASGPADQRYEA